MTLNITVLSRRVIYQSGDFRLTDQRGRFVDFRTQKQILVDRFHWSAVVAFSGVDSVGRFDVSKWLAADMARIGHKADFDALISVLM